MNKQRAKMSFSIIMGMVAIIVLTFASYFPSLKNGFVNWDDPVYLLENQSIRQLSWENLKVIFSSFVNGNYQPLTIFTFACEYHFFQLKPFIYHWNNLLLHICNAILVFYLISRLSPNKFSPFVVSLLFAIHPMHVESVAWATERKDVLFAFFYLLSLISYLKSLDTSKYRYLLGAFLFFVLSLLSKPAAVSLPLILCLLDYYKGRKGNRTVIYEKVPFVLTSFVFGLIALYAAQIPWEDPYPLLHQFTFIERIFLSFYALIQYVWKLFLPINLSCYYPYPRVESGMLPYFYYIAVMGLFTLIGIIAVNFRKQKILIFGLLFYFFTILFNLHFYSVGRVLMADRFTYIPYIGLFFLLSEYAYSFYLRNNFSWLIKKILLVSLVFVFATLSVFTWNRCKVWRNSIRLWSDVVAKFPNEPMAYYNRVFNFIEWGAIDLAISDYLKGISLVPYPEAYCGLGNMYFLKGLDTLALENYSKAIALDANYINAYLNRAEYYRIKGRLEDALKDYNRALELDPYHKNALSRRDRILNKINQEGIK